MMWRAWIVIMGTVTTALLLWAAYTWQVEGTGLNPLIALPAAVIVYFNTIAFIAREAYKTGIHMADYLEWLEKNDEDD